MKFKVRNASNSPITLPTKKGNVLVKAKQEMEIELNESEVKQANALGLFLIEIKVPENKMAMPESNKNTKSGDKKSKDSTNGGKR